MNWTIVALLGALGTGAWLLAREKKKTRTTSSSTNRRTWEYRGWTIEAEMAPNFMWNWTATPPDEGEAIVSTSSTMTLALEEAKRAIDEVMQ